VGAGELSGAAADAGPLIHLYEIGGLAFWVSSMLSTSRTLYGARPWDWVAFRREIS
jgi:hypothetical protein